MTQNTYEVLGQHQPVQHLNWAVGNLIPVFDAQGNPLLWNSNNNRGLQPFQEYWIRL